LQLSPRFQGSDGNIEISAIEVSPSLHDIWILQEDQTFAAEIRFNRDP